MEAQLNRVRGSRAFAGSKRLAGLLTHLAEAALAGRSADLTETSIAQDVFGRDQTFDPKIDSAVRVALGRLRNELTAYFAGEGAGDPVRIELPPRSLELRFEQRNAPAQAPPVATAASAPRPKSNWWIIAPAIFGLIATIVFAGWSRWSRPRPALGWDLRELSTAAGGDPNAKYLLAPTDAGWMLRRPEELSGNKTEAVLLMHLRGRVRGIGIPSGWSPDGEWMAKDLPTEGGTRFVAVSADGKKKAVLPFVSQRPSGWLVWTPDSKHLIHEDGDDWMVAPLDGSGPGVRIGGLRDFTAQRLTRSQQKVQSLQGVSRDWLYFIAKAEQSGPRLYRARYRLDQGRMTGGGEAVSAEGQLVTVARVTVRDQVVYESYGHRSTLSTLPIDADEGKILGVRATLENSGGLSLFGPLQLLDNDRRLVFTAVKEPNPSLIYTWDFANPPKAMSESKKAEFLIAATPRTILFNRTEQEQTRLLFSRGGVEAAMPPSVIAAYNLSADGSEALVETTEPNEAGKAVPVHLRRDLTTGATTPLLRAGNVDHPRLSPSGKWLAFVDFRADGVRIIPASGRKEAAPEPEWIALPIPGDGKCCLMSPQWSPGERWLYYGSTRSGQFQWFGQKLDAIGKRPLGDPKLLESFPDVELDSSRSPVTFSVGMAKAAFLTTQSDSRIWTATPR